MQLTGLRVDDGLLHEAVGAVLIVALIEMSMGVRVNGDGCAGGIVAESATEGDRWRPQGWPTTPPLPKGRGRDDRHEFGLKARL